MNPEWVTDNVKRAWNLYIDPTGGFQSDPVLISDLQEAIELLHFTAERVGLRWWQSSGCVEDGRYLYHVWFGGRRTSDFRRHFGSVGSFDSPGKTADSLLHAILLAIDAIVEHKKELFA